MSAILRASGASFDVDSFTKDSSLVIDLIFRIGDPVRPTVAPDGRKLKSSGFSVVVSEVDFDDYKQQFKEAYFFMRAHEDELIRLAGFPGLQSLCIDFGANINPPGWCSFRFPHTLLRMAGRVKTDLELSIYPTDSEDDSAGDEKRELLDEAYAEFVAQRTQPGEQATDGSPH